MKSKKIISIVLITILLLVTTKIYAANDNYNTTISANISPVKRGDNVIITIGLADLAIESGEKGICAYTGSIQFDSSVLEYVSTGSTDKWEAPFYQDGLITGETKDGEVVNTTQAIGTITFKVKDNAKLGETTISLTNFSGTTIEKDVTTANKSVKIVIEDKENAGNSENNSGDNNNSGNNNPGNNNNGNGSNNNNNNGNAGSNNSGNNNSNNQNGNNNSNVKPIMVNEVTDTSAKQENKLPKTGTSDIAIFMAIGVCITLATIFSIKLRLIKK